MTAMRNPVDAIWHQQMKLFHRPDKLNADIPSEPDRKEVERYQVFVILLLWREDGGTRCLGMIPLALSIDGMANAIQAT